jgi:hypothetical protein
MDIVREHDMIVFTILAREHGIATANFSRKKRHALVFMALPLRVTMLNLIKSLVSISCGKIVWPL